MNTRMVLSLGASALLFGGTVVGCAGHGDGIASASDRDAAAASRTAARDASQAAKALRKHDAARAVAQAEAAVALQPRNADYRLLLGQSYLQSGRFASAREALGDALALAPDNGKAALNLALAQIAMGDWSAARKTLEDHGSGIAPADRGLAMALAGDPTGGVGVLTAAARSGEANATVRQNLALSYALAGQWQAARMVASADMSPADVDARMEQWAAFAHPSSASDQVASLLGVQSVEDSGQPVALALNAAVPPAPAAASEAPVQTAELSPDVGPPPPPPAESVQPDHGPVLAEQEVPPPVNLVPFKLRTAAKAVAVPTRAPRAQRVATIRADTTPIKVAAAAAPARDAARVALRPAVRPTAPALVRAAARTPVPAPAKGSWFVQLGAYESPAVAKDAWGRATRRLPALAGNGPSGTSVTTKAGQFYRLSVGGYARGDAVQLCQRFRAIGGQCFVRAGAGDQVAQWVVKPTVRKPGVQMASR